MYHIMKGKVVGETIRVEETFIIIPTGLSSLYCRQRTNQDREAMGVFGKASSLRHPLGSSRSTNEQCSKNHISTVFAKFH